MGFATTANGYNSVALGAGAFTASLGDVSIGANSVATSTTVGGVAIGYAANAVADSTIGIGTSAAAGGNSSIVIGASSNDGNFAQTIILAAGVTAVRANQMILGSQNQGCQLVSTGTITTANATPTTLYSFTVNSSTGSTVEFTINATLGANSKTASYYGIFKANCNGVGTVTLSSITNYTAIIDTPDLTGTAITATTTGAGNISIQVTGLASTNIKWSGKLELTVQAY
jgi:hypothetical protein